MRRFIRARLSLGQFERWLASPEAQTCVHRRGRPGTGERPLVAEAARRFQVDRRTIERALSRLARRRRLLAEHLPVDAATAAHLLGAAKSFVQAENATSYHAQMRQSAEQGSQSLLPQGLMPVQPPSRETLKAAVLALVEAGRLLPEDLILPAISPENQRSTADQLAAVGLRTPVQAQLPSNHPVQVALTNLRTALDQG